MAGLPSPAPESPRLRLAGPRRRWIRYAGAAAIIALGSGIAVGWDVLGEQERVPVLTVAHDLPAGHVLSDADLVVVQVSGMDSAQVMDAREQDVVGQRLALPVAEGALLSDGVLGDNAAFPQPGEAIVAAALAPGALPTSAREGAPVAIVTDATSQEVSEPEEDSSADAGEGRTVEGRVHTIDAASEESEPGVEAVVELVVAAEDAAHVARSAGDQRLRLVVTEEAG